MLVFGPHQGLPEHRPDVLLHRAVFALFRDYDGFPAKEGRQRFHGALRDPCVIFQKYFTFQKRQVPNLPAAFVDLPDPDPVDEGLVEPPGDLLRGEIALHLEIQQLADALQPYGQGQSNGYGGPGIKSLGVLQWQIRPGKGTLEQPHQVQVGDPHCRAGFLEQGSKHRTSPLSAGSWPRTRHSPDGSLA